jgi:uncharacterized membrane protein YgdD (TMEM256/DUF423 family)
MIWGALFGMLGVIFGAFGAHALADSLDPSRLAVFETAVRYQLWHALALICTELLRRQQDVQPLRWVSRLFTAGVVLFSGSLYLLVFLDQPRWGIVTPFGGASLIAGWGLLLVAGVRLRPNR